MVLETWQTAGVCVCVLICSFDAGEYFRGFGHFIIANAPAAPIFWIPLLVNDDSYRDIQCGNIQKAAKKKKARFPGSSGSHHFYNKEMALKGESASLELTRKLDFIQLGLNKGVWFHSMVT